MCPSNRHVPQVSPLPAHESGFSAASPVAHSLPGCAPWNQQLIVRWRFPMAWKLPPLRKSPQSLCRPAKYKTPAARHPAAACATRRLRGRPAVCSAPVSNAARGRSREAAPPLREPALNCPYRKARRASPLRADRRGSLESLATIRGALALRSAAAIARRVSCVCEESEQKSLLQSRQTPAARSARISTARSRQCSARACHYIRRLESHDSSRDGVRNSRRHVVQVCAVVHDHA